MRGHGERDDFDALLIAALGGSPTARDQLFTIAMSRFDSWARSHPCGSRCRALFDDDDIFQSAALDAARRLESFHGHSRRDFINWFDRIFSNKQAELLRHFFLTKMRDASRERPLKSNCDFDARTTRCGDVAFERAPQEEGAAAISEALLVLNERDRRVIELRFWRHLPWRAIADELGESVDAVRSSCRRSIVRLRRDPRLAALDDAWR